MESSWQCGTGIESPLRLQMASENGQPLIKPRLHGAERTALQVSDLLEGHAVVLLQDDRRPLLVRQQRHGLGDDLAQIVPRHQRFNGLDRPLFARELEEIDALRRGLDGRAALAADPGATEVQGNPVDPGRELRLAAEVLDAAERPQEGLLDDVPGLFFAADDAVREGIDRPLPAQDELVEAVYVAVN